MKIRKCAMNAAHIFPYFLGPHPLCHSLGPHPFCHFSNKIHSFRTLISSDWFTERLLVMDSSSSKFIQKLGAQLKGVLTAEWALLNMAENSHSCKYHITIIVLSCNQHHKKEIGNTRDTIYLDLLDMASKTVLKTGHNK